MVTTTENRNLTNLLNSDQRFTKQRVISGKKLAKLFSAKYFFGRDWNLREPTFTLEQITSILRNAGSEIKPETIVKETFFVHNLFIDFYYFEKTTDKYGNPLYRLKFLRSNRDPAAYHRDYRD